MPISDYTVNQITAPSSSANRITSLCVQLLQAKSTVRGIFKDRSACLPSGEMGRNQERHTVYNKSDILSV